MSNAEIKSFKNQIVEASTSGAMKDATVFLSMEIEVKCAGIDHANKLCKQITASVEKVVVPDPLADRGL